MRAETLRENAHHSAWAPPDGIGGLGGLHARQQQEGPQKGMDNVARFTVDMNSHAQTAVRQIWRSAGQQGGGTC